ncbi:DUF2784 domain-containing protein [Massilia sp. Leaf139]|uniref:DUF2784 domain-containing protein n=1 Tax=Massilia sp. Leaf139 TaxID=1736272 RepID=UPI0006F3D087|nr:DUF2784 domain-containing protein [Massilia sp. Leaf139]KQQ97411.1 hypothetical protein ASF77_05560 [Massilia sp. Leaf139]
MWYAIAAALVLLAHLAFVLFVVFGAVLVLRWPRMAWLHLPAALWGVYIEVSGRGCPLTLLENLLRLRAGMTGYSEGFLEHYVLWLLYPEGLTRAIQFVLAGAVAAINLLLYAWIWRRRRQAKALRHPKNAA